MVNASDIPEITTLIARYTTYQRALNIIDDNGSVSSFTVSGPKGSQQISAEDITSPPTMLPAIRDQVQLRVDDLTQQLAALGVTLSS